MRKFFLGILAIVLLLLAYIFLNIFSAPNLQPNESPLPSGAVGPATGFEQRLASAVRHKTISYQDKEQDTAAFKDFHKFLFAEYPNVFSNVRVDTFRNFSLLLKLNGSDPNLKPILMLAHQDVVPVEEASLSEWAHPPFSGDIEEGIIWGRGTLDDKSGVLGILEGLEVLLKNGFSPNRDFYFAFGEDEEIGGYGAKAIADHFREKGVTFELILDEGGTLSNGIVPGVDQPVALIGTAEKGYVSFKISTTIEGGHSSMPEGKTAPRGLVDALYKLNHDPFENEFSEPIKGFMAYLGPVLPFVQRMAFANPALFGGVIFGIYEKSGSGRALIHTTMEPTVIKSGVSDNVIPAKAEAVINLRLLPGETPESAKERIVSVIEDSEITVEVFGHTTLPSDVSDYQGEGFVRLSKTVKQVFPEAVIAPFLTLAATDTRHFKGLSDQIFRILPNLLEADDLRRIHGINERIPVKSYQNTILFYQTFLLNFSE